MAKVKPVQELKIVGQSPQRYDIPAKVDGSLKWAVDVKLPGMVHARNVKPPFAGAKLISIDESSVRGMPGFIKVVSKGNYVAVVCEREEQAINAARQLKANWEKPATAPFPSSEDLFKYMRGADAHVQFETDRGGRSRTRRSRARRRSSKPITTSRSRGTRRSVRRHAMADPSNGQMTIYSNDMKSYGMRRGVADFSRHAAARKCASSGWKARRVSAAPPPTMRDARRPIWPKRSAARFACSGCGTKRRPGIPRLRRSRSRCAEGWMPRGIWWRYDYNARAADYNHVGYNEPDTVLIAQLMGIEARQARRGQRGHAFGNVRDPQSPHGHRRW